MNGRLMVVCHDIGQFDLGLFRRFAQPLHGLFVFAQINPLLLLELIGHEVYDALVKVIAAQMRVARRGAHFKDAVADIQHADTSNVPPPRS